MMMTMKTHSISNKTTKKNKARKNQNQNQKNKNKKKKRKKESKNKRLLNHPRSNVYFNRFRQQQRKRKTCESISTRRIKSQKYSQKHE
jgi:hypothetical protein